METTVPALTAWWVIVGIGLVVLLGLSVMVRRRRRAPVRQAPGPGRAAVAALSWRDFELLAGEYFRRRGYSVVESQRGADGGVDLKLAKEGQAAVVHCKRWLMRDVSLQVVREVHGLVRNKADTAGMVVASGGFTPEARKFAEQARIELIDGTSLARALDGDRPATQAAQLTCPLCDGAMSPRTQRRGARAGLRYLACNDYPKCRGSRDIDQ
jgi:restriction system protein